MEQVDHLKIPVSKNDREKISEIDRKIKPDDYSSKYALEFSKFMKGRVKGLIYTGLHDGECCVIYDPSIVVIVAFKDTFDKKWTRFDDNSIKQSMSKSKSGDFETKKYEIGKDLESIARSEKTNPLYLTKLSKIDDDFIRSLVARNLSTPIDTLIELSKDLKTAKYIAANINTPEEILIDLLKGSHHIIAKIIAERVPPIKNEEIIRKLHEEFSGDKDILLSILRNPNTPSDIIANHAGGDGWWHQVPALSNPNCPVEILKKVYDKIMSDFDDYESVYYKLRSIVSNKNCPTEIIRKIAEDLDPINTHEYNLLCAIAKSEASAPDILNFLITNFHQDDQIAISVALNKNATDQVFRNILRVCRYGESVFFKMITNPNMNKQFLQKLLHHPDATKKEETQIGYEIEKRDQN